MNRYDLRNNFNLNEWNTAITSEDFEKFFSKTNEKVTFTFNGWDGKSYDGETRRASAYKTSVAGYEDVIFVKVGRGVHFVDLDSMVEEKATGEKHPQAFWLVDVMKKEVQ